MLACPLILFDFPSLHFKVTDFIEGGDLQQMWQNTGSFHEDLIKIYVAEVALVLGKLFKLIIHIFIKFLLIHFFFNYRQISFTMPVSFTGI